MELLLNNLVTGLPSGRTEGHGDRVVSSRALPRRVAILACALFMAAAGLGLVAPTPADASCAGPQLALEQGGATVPPRRVGEGESEKLLYDISRNKPLRINGSNLTFDCQDTYSATQRGCGAPHPDPIVAMQNPKLVLAQRGRTWTLGRVGAIGPDLTAQVEIDLPPAVRPGPAVLAMLDQKEARGAQLDLLIT